MEGGDGGVASARGSQHLLVCSYWAQECLVFRGLGPKVPHGVLFECFWAPGSECPTECFLSAFWHFLSPKSAKEHSKKHSLGHSEPGAQKHSKSTPWGTFGRRPLNTPVNGGRDRRFGSDFSLDKSFGARS